MLISLILVGFILWLFFKGVGLALRMTWGLAKLIGVVLTDISNSFFADLEKYMEQAAREINPRPAVISLTNILR